MSDLNDRMARKAVALHYDADGDAAPRVIAKGDRLLAERIIEIAKQNDIPIHEDPDLVAILSALDVNREIPQSLYRAVAEVLAFVYSVNQDVRGRSF
ncbi:MAG TPA: EscU/YscU/HrcU family type III secretion system export apparatus switch protein [Candidatus Hydrogenedentes bacterium]|nr:EscU/YscU/HrcU family type III secretion system export apparatus switch protein [Candidatus Hydrogenedentota bacterium]HRK34583.1 EscU/YscU/HrcU family type III secretion system export apparatus switch protein [Candidatus Hydrogenedentota bacterium]